MKTLRGMLMSREDRSVWDRPNQVGTKELEEREEHCFALETLGSRIPCHRQFAIAKLYVARALRSDRCAVMVSLIGGWPGR